MLVVEVKAMLLANARFVHGCATVSRYASLIPLQITSLSSPSAFQPVIPRRVLNCVMGAPVYGWYLASSFESLSRRGTPEQALRTTADNSSQAIRFLISILLGRGDLR